MAAHQCAAPAFPWNPVFNERQEGKLKERDRNRNVKEKRRGGRKKNKNQVDANIYDEGGVIVGTYIQV